MIILELSAISGITGVLVSLGENHMPTMVCESLAFSSQLGQVTWADSEVYPIP